MTLSVRRLHRLAAVAAVAVTVRVEGPRVSRLPAIDAHRRSAQAARALGESPERLRGETARAQRASLARGGSDAAEADSVW